MALTMGKIFLTAFFIPYLAWGDPVTAPGLKVLPKDESKAESSLIWYKSEDRESIMSWTEKLDRALLGYGEPAGLATGSNHNRMNCNYNHPPAPGKVCDMEIKNLSPCTRENLYNFHRARPCIFLKFNKVPGWRPEFYNDTNNLPTQMPEDLKNHIRSLRIIQHNSINTVWVSCDGENPADKEHIGAIQYLPHRGFPGYFFPFENQEGYLSPLVAVLFERPAMGVLINIECKIWAPNIDHSAVGRQGIIHFELMID